MYYHTLQNLADGLKEIAYPLKAPQKVRTVPMQVLAVGPPRSGTDSLRAALVRLGYQHVYHGYDIALNPADDKAWWKLYQKKWRGRGTIPTPDDTTNKNPSAPILTAADFDAVIGHCAAITDLDAAVFAHDLIRAYPAAQVILNVRRDRDAWRRSVQRTILHLKNDWRMWLRSFFCVELFWVEENLLRRLWPAFCRGGDFEHTGRWVLEEHCAMVRGSVSDLLEWSVEDGWEPLCRFLGKPVPNEPFPNGNSSEEFKVRVEELYASFNRRADRNIAMAIGAVGLLALVVYMPCCV
ncbi:hypothetical protein PG991_007853 [Apiospora marii]|uniref:P-loop containing nucleoside triphosphate hydrolase protein n=1 Tax=Apiospora marii TaxID=335849 RepID=A0ABR1RWN8_9PEZI